MSGAIGESEWGARFLSKVLDKEFEPARDYLFANRWHATLVMDHVGLMEAEWLANAVAPLQCEKLIGVACEFKGPPIVVDVVPTRDGILRYLFDYTWAFRTLTDASESFLHYHNQDNSFSLVAGKNAFVKAAYPVSFQTVQAMWNGAMTDPWMRAPEAAHFRRVMEKYAAFGPV